MFITFWEVVREVLGMYPGLVSNAYELSRFVLQLFRKFLERIVPRTTYQIKQAFLKRSCRLPATK